MKFDFDDFSFQDEINFMNLNKQIENSRQMNFDTTIGFNDDTIYQKIEDK